MTYSWVGQLPHSWLPPATHEWVTRSLELSDHLSEAVNEHARVSFPYNSLGFPVEERCDEYLIERSRDKHGLIVPLRGSLSTQLSYERNAYGDLVCFRAEIGVDLDSLHLADDKAYGLLLHVLIIGFDGVDETIGAIFV